MAPNAQTRTRSTKTTTTTTVVTPNMQLTCTPPPGPAHPIAGTPITQLDTPSTVSPPPQTTIMQKSPIKNAQDALNIALGHLNKHYQNAANKQKEGEDPSKIT